MEDPADEFLVRLAMDRGYLAEEVVEACREIQDRIRRAGARRSLIDIFLDRGELSPEQAAEIRRDASKRGIRSRVGTYELEEKLGEGASSSVYRARHVKTGKRFAVKLLRDRHADDPRYLRDFEKELEVIRTLRHPNVVRGYEGGWGAGYRYFVMEYVMGENLGAIVRRQGPVTERAAVHVAARLADAIAYLAERRVVHCDIKPSNVIVSDRGLVKLSDWGSAKLRGFRVRRDPAELLMATPPYMPPEMVTVGARIDSRSDLYSLGATLYYLLSGRTPFRGASVKEIVRKIRKEDPPSLRALRPEVSESLADLIEKLMFKDRSERMRDPAQLREILTEMDSIRRA